MYKKLGTLALTGTLALSLAACSETEETAKKYLATKKLSKQILKKKIAKSLKLVKRFN
nr:hypothetical protein [Bacillus thuringiensis]